MKSVVDWRTHGSIPEFWNGGKIRCKNIAYDVRAAVRVASMQLQRTFRYTLFKRKRMAMIPAAQNNWSTVIPQISNMVPYPVLKAQQQQQHQRLLQPDGRRS